MKEQAMSGPARSSTAAAEILESGDIYFLYRPRVQHESAQDIEDVQRMHIVFKPEGRQLYRMAAIGRKRLPEIEAHERHWGFIEKVAHSADEIRRELGEAHYPTATRGERTRPAARPAGEGVYAFVQAGRSMHLVYALELPKRPGPVQRDLGLEAEGSFVVSIKNPERGAPPGVGLSEARKAEYPEEKQAEFGSRRFAPSDPGLLDYEGAEFVLIGARRDAEEAYRVELQTEVESLDTAEIVRDLRLRRRDRLLEPLLSGAWA
jgi:hypothetical protein